MQTVNRQKFFLGLAIVLIICGAIMYYAQNCGHMDEVSDVQTLDNFASNKIRANLCVGEHTRVVIDPTIEFDQAIDRQSAHGQDVLSAVILSLTAVPESVRAVFFAHGGRIRVASAQKIENMCKAILGESIDQTYAAQNGALTGCWSTDSESSGAIQILLADDLGAIRHHTVRFMGRIIGDVFGELPAKFSPNEQQIFPQLVKGSQDFIAERKKLAQTFIDEIQNKNLQGDNSVTLSSYSSLFTSPEGIDRFSKYVFGEAFDSYYCTRAANGSYDTMIQKFPNTFASFKGLAERFLDRTDEQLDRLAASVSSATTGLALEGGQPVRKESPWQLITRAFSEIDPGTSMNSVETTKIYGANSAATKRALQRESPEGQRQIQARTEQSNRDNKAKIENLKRADQAIGNGVHAVAQVPTKFLSWVPDGGTTKKIAETISAPIVVLDKLNAAGEEALRSSEQRGRYYDRTIRGEGNDRTDAQEQQRQLVALEKVSNDGVNAGLVAYRTASVAFLGAEVIQATNNATSIGGKNQTIAVQGQVKQLAKETFRKTLGEGNAELASKVIDSGQDALNLVLAP